jgi:hypothetical protein
MAADALRAGRSWSTGPGVSGVDPGGQANATLGAGCAGLSSSRTVHSRVRVSNASTSSGETHPASFDAMAVPP